MKKIYSLLIALMLLPCLAAAQNTSGRTYLGYAKYDDQIWEYDGIYLDHDAKVGCAILLTREMLAPYVGGTIVGMRVGWCTSQRSGTYEGFVRNTFNGEDLSTGKATVSYSYSASAPGWTNMTMTSYEIPEDVEQLVVGFNTSIKKNEYAIPNFYPHYTPNSCYLWVEGDMDAEGNPRWVDMNELGILPILLTIRDSKGTFNFLPAITLLTHDGVVATGEAGDCLMRVKNGGSQTIRNIEVTSRQGEQSWSKTISLSTSINPGLTSKIFMAPLYAFHSGDLEMSITKVNGSEVTNPKVHKLNLIGVPPSVDEAYLRRPLVEYYESENNYMSPRHYDEIVGPIIEKKKADITFVCQHLDDQFMTGDDDATVLALRLCDGDSSQVSIPAMTIDRDMTPDNILFQMNSASNPMFSVLYDPYGTQAIEAAINHPTFVNVEVSGEVKEDGETLQVTVGGDIANGIMPEGEQPRLTVYLMESNVETDSQIFWTEKEKEESMGHYTHANIIREILTAPEGDVINAEGAIQATYTTTLYPEYNRENVYLVAFVHRDGSRGGRYMCVFNSAEGNITDPTGIISINNGQGTMDNEVHAIYDLSGRHVAQPTKGIYIKNGKKIVVR